MTGMNKPREKPITLYLRGFTHSEGTRRIKAGPTGQPDKPDQKEHTERRGVHLVFMRVGSQRAVKPITSPPPSLITHSLVAHKQMGAQTKMHLVNSIVEVGTATTLCALVFSDSQSISAPAQTYQRPRGCSARLQEAAGGDCLQAKCPALIFSS